MFPVSETFSRAAGSGSRRYEWTGEIKTRHGSVFKFTSADIIRGSGYIRRQICGDTEPELGTVYASELGITLLTDIDRYTLEGAEIKMFFTIAGETIPMGVFEVSEADRNIRTLEIKAYDHMLRFDKALSMTSSNGTPYSFLKTACDVCDVKLSQSAAFISSLPNGKSTLGVYPENDIETYRDLIFYVSQALGCFCLFDRYGRLELKQYGNTPCLEIEQRHRYDSSYSDFVTRYTAISSTNMMTKKSEYVALDKDDGLTMDLGSNPLLQTGLKETREKYLGRILESLGKIEYIPFDASVTGNPALDPGDIIRLTGGHADGDKISCITSIEYRVNGKMILKGVGKDPRLSSANSKNDKNIAGLLSSVESGRYVCSTFMNVSPYTVGSSFTEVLSIEFMASGDTSALFQCEILLNIDTEDKTELSVLYKTDDDPVNEFTPAQTYTAGKHILTLFYPLSITGDGELTRFSVSLKLSSGSGSVGEGQIRAVIGGTGIAVTSGERSCDTRTDETAEEIVIDTGEYNIIDFKDKAGVTLPVLTGSGVSDRIGDISMENKDFIIGDINDRQLVSEILRSFTLTSVRGHPEYGAFITVNDDGAFALRSEYIITSQEKDTDTGYLQELIIDTTEFEEIEGAEFYEDNGDGRGDTGQ